jgi:hypothetical protein
MIRDKSMVETMLQALGDRLAAAESPATIVVLGGVAMNLHGFVDRPTRDVDVLARREEPEGPLLHPDPLPQALREAIAEVALDFDQPPDWMNTVVAHQWGTGLPPGLEQRLTWRSYSALRVGLVAREDLIAFKLYAAADHGPRSVHVSDLAALRPTARELGDAAAWIRTQDTSPAFHTLVERVIAHVRQRPE